MLKKIIFVTIFSVAGTSFFYGISIAGVCSELGLPNACIQTTDMGRGLVNSYIIKTGSVKSIDIQNGGVQSVDIADGAVQSIDIADNSITSADIANGTITSADIATGTITGVEISDTANIVLGTIYPQYIWLENDNMYNSSNNADDFWYNRSTYDYRFIMDRDNDNIASWFQVSAIIDGVELFSDFMNLVGI